MALRVNYNYQADFGHVNLMKNERNLNTSLERLESGLRINSAKDDAAGLFIADQLNLVAKALDQGSRNANDGISASQIAESTLSQIYDKLSSMYTKASQAANDVNDPSARQALQRDIQAIVDAIDKMANQSEFNGIKLLDGTFKNKAIHYGARADQTLDISISSAKATDLGASVLEASGATGKAGDTYANLIANNWKKEANDTIKIAGVDLNSNVANGAVDAKNIADAVNANETLQKLGIEASAKNVSTAATWNNISVASGDTVSLKFFIGESTTEAFTLEYGGGSVITLDDIVSKINEEASAKGVNLTAAAVNGKLVLKTEGETIGIEAKGGANTEFNLNQFLEGANQAANATQGSAVKVGALELISENNFSYDFSGVSTATEGLGVAATGSSSLKNLISLDVTTNDGAELAMKVIDVAIKKVDKGRSELGSIQQKLQAIIDNNDFAATQTREAESRIRNVDFAKEMAEFTKSQTLMQSGVAMLAQAKQLPQMMLQLLR